MGIEKPRKAIVLAAGLGKRLRPYTDEIPKPLLPVAGKALIDWTLDHLEHSEIDEVVINTFYRANKLQEHLAPRMFPQIHIVVEEELLGTGGAIQNAMKYFGKDPFFALQSNIIWINKTRSALDRLADYFDNDKMDILALVVDKTKMPWFKGKGDFMVEDTDYRLRRLPTGQDSPIVSAGIYLIHPRVFEKISDGAFPLTAVLDEAAGNNRLYGLLHQGDWFGISTAQDYQAVNRILTG